MSYPRTLDEQLYLRIAHDYLSGALPESTTETDFMRRYDASRHLVLATLTLLSEEGIIHRGKGREWRFRDVLKSSRGREESYELRLMIEPGAVLLPTFQIARSELEEMRTLQQKLLNVTAEPSHREVFHTDASFHELIARFSGNGLVLAAIRQQNRVRRLLEYQSNLDADRVRTWSLEHIGVIDALLEGRPTSCRSLPYKASGKCPSYGSHREAARSTPASASGKKPIGAVGAVIQHERCNSR